MSAPTAARDAGKEPSAPIALVQSIVGAPEKSPSKVIRRPGLEAGKREGSWMRIGRIHRPGNRRDELTDLGLSRKSGELPRARPRDTGLR